MIFNKNRFHLIIQATRENFSEKLMLHSARIWKQPPIFPLVLSLCRLVDHKILQPCVARVAFDSRKWLSLGAATKRSFKCTLLSNICPLLAASPSWTYTLKWAQHLLQNYVYQEGCEGRQLMLIALRHFRVALALPFFPPQVSEYFHFFFFISFRQFRGHSVKCFLCLFFCYVPGLCDYQRSNLW